MKKIFVTCDEEYPYFKVLSNPDPEIHSKEIEISDQEAHTLMQQQDNTDVLQKMLGAYYYGKPLKEDEPLKVQEFDRIVQDMRKVFIAKNHDYGSSDGFDNILALGLKGIFVRAWDKVSRLRGLVWTGKEAKVKDEKVEDTWLDLAVYSIIALIVLRDKWK